MSLFEELKRRNVFRMAVLYGVASWVILQVADVLFDAMELPATWTRLILAVLILGLPIVLIFSWIYEMTPEGIKREKDVDRSRSVTPETGRKINVLIVILLVIAIATVAVDRLLPEKAPVAGTPTMDPQEPAEPSEPADPTELAASMFAPPPDRSVAVLPFANRSAREEDAYFVDGIHDDILTQLARIGSLTVISRTSVEKFRGTSQSIKEIGDTLGVKNILEGGVQRAGDRVRINMQLIDVTTDGHLWAQTYDRELTTANIFAIQSEISTAIADALEATLSPQEKAQLDDVQTENMAALEAYFLGRQAMAKRTSAALAEAEAHFKKAVGLDPDYALAYVGLAETYVLQASYSGQSRVVQNALAQPLIDKALTINDRLGEAYVAKAEIVEVQDKEAAERLFRKGIELAPGYVTGRHWFGNLLASTDRPDEALAQLEEAARLDPLSPIVRVALGGSLERLGRMDEAREQYESALRIDPGFPNAHNTLGFLQVTTGHLDEALVHFYKAASLDPGNPQHPFTLAITWELLGDRSRADLAAARVRTIDAAGWWSAWTNGFIYALRGDLAAASAEARIALETTPDDAFSLRYLSLYDLQAGRGEVAVERYVSAYPGFASKTDPVVDRENYDAATHLASLLKATGEEDRASVLLERALAVTEDLPRKGQSGIGTYAAQIYALQGRTEEAVAALRRAVDNGQIFIFDFNQDFASMSDDPGYQAIRAEMDAMVAEQLANALQMEADGRFEPLPQ
ncbi:MAG: tetratricopeptide repeat protein [Gammaproteobacteria bacterium]|nr:MAG: tetratricopeptide repeat protein [Gammaproteobacteria bacterium]